MAARSMRSEVTGLARRDREILSAPCWCLSVVRASMFLDIGGQWQDGPLRFPPAPEQKRGAIEAQGTEG